MKKKGKLDFSVSFSGNLPIISHEENQKANKVKWIKRLFL